VLDSAFCARLADLLDRLVPAQVYEPTRPKTFFTQVAADFNDATTPVMFNAYAVHSGRELVFCNQAAFRIEPITIHRPLGYFNYFVEKLPNYTEGYEQAKQVFQRDVAGTPVTASRQ
jgi:hypothetical protein